MTSVYRKYDRGINDEIYLNEMRITIVESRDVKLYIKIKYKDEKKNARNT